jgi:DNA polymerase III delta prime subunit
MRTVIRTGDIMDPNTIEGRKVTNAILLSGPHGCGKSAAAHAIAKELGFEVFEINSGGRRSGKDILDRVGDMTRNHLVQHGQRNQDDSSTEDDTAIDTEALKKELESGRQGTMKSFFKARPQEIGSTKAKAVNKKQLPSKPTLKSEKETLQQQKQSVILLEEVDILFEEDRQFWSTISALILQSKRPVIMTCNDESLVPLEELSLHAILRFGRAPRETTIDYLLLLAANEGHLLRRIAVETLYEAKDGDLRASIMELQFWCQMAVGDQKGGLEWMYLEWPPERNVNGQGERIRVASKDTYHAGMGWLKYEDVSSEEPGDAFVDDEQRLLSEAWDGWNVNVESWHDVGREQDTLTDVSDLRQWSSMERLRSLRSYEECADVLSAVDASVGHGLLANHNVSLPLDITISPIPLTKLDST